MNVVVRFRIFFARYRWVRWAVVALLAMTTGWLNHRHAMGIERARDMYLTTCCPMFITITYQIIRFA